jgi:Rod binding domain-containing protein
MAVEAAHLLSGGARVLAAHDTGLNAPAGSARAKARHSAEEFEAVFLQAMIGEMFAGVGKEGPLGEGEAGGAWRSMLIDGYARTLARSGGIGIADSVYPTILTLQESSARETLSRKDLRP